MGVWVLDVACGAGKTVQVCGEGLGVWSRTFIGASAASSIFIRNLILPASLTLEICVVRVLTGLAVQIKLKYFVLESRGGQEKA